MVFWTTGLDLGVFAGKTYFGSRKVYLGKSARAVLSKSSSLLGRAK